MQRDLAIIGAATDLGQKKAGTELAPSWLRLKGAHQVLTRKFFSVEDLGDINPEETHLESAEKKHQSISRYNQRLCDVASDCLERRKTLLTLGGDHSIAIGTVAGSLKHNPDTKIVWVDAHADLNTPETSPSGNLHGMPLAFFFDLVEEVDMKKTFSWTPGLKTENLVYIGLRDVDPGERKYIEELGITAFYAEDVTRLGIETVLEQTLDQLAPKGDEDLHLSFDVDGLDPIYIPATGTPVPGGLNLYQGQYIINELFRKSNVISFDLVEVNPMLGANTEELEKTAESVAGLLEAIPSWTDSDQNVNNLIFDRDDRLSPQ